MEPFALWFLLNLCTGYWPNDAEATMRSCELQFQAKMRNIEPGPDYRFGRFSAGLSSEPALTPQLALNSQE